MLKIVTLNILIDLYRWNLRGQLIVTALRDLNPDVIAFQEVDLPTNTAQWIADHLDGYSVFLAPNSGLKEGEGLAILTRLPIEKHEILDLGPQNRKVQLIYFQQNGETYVLANTHLFWQNGNAPERKAQAQLILNHLADLPVNTHQILCGDFNSEPDSPTISLVKQSMHSAYESINGTEPAFTCPTPLDRSLKSRWWQLKNAINQPKNLVLNNKTTIDYIFLNPSLQAVQSQLVFDQPYPTHTHLFASDHFGIMAEVKPASLNHR